MSGLRALRSTETDTLKARLARKLRRLEEELRRSEHHEPRSRRAENHPVRAVPSLMYVNADKEGLKRGVAVEVSVQGGTHLEIRRNSILRASVSLKMLLISRASRADRVVSLEARENPESSMHLHFQDDASFSEFWDQVPSAGKEREDKKVGAACRPSGDKAEGEHRAGNQANVSSPWEIDDDHHHSVVRAKPCNPPDVGACGARKSRPATGRDAKLCSPIDCDFSCLLGTVSE